MTDLRDDMQSRSWTALVALGSNMSNGALGPEDIIAAALDALQDPAIRVTSTSGFYRTPCFPAGAGPDYVNAAASLETALSPTQLMVVLHEVEAAFGRQRKERWGMRTLDLDLLAHEDSILPDRPTWEHWRNLQPEAQQQVAPSELVLPHPRLQDRAFVLVPLAEVAPGWIHPATGQTVESMRDALPRAERDEVKLLSLR